jgi:hypothetical protein
MNIPICCNKCKTLSTTNFCSNIACNCHKQDAAKGFSEDYYAGFRHGRSVAIEEGRKQLAEELKRLLEIEP